MKYIILSTIIVQLNLLTIANADVLTGHKLFCSYKEHQFGRPGQQNTTFEFLSSENEKMVLVSENGSVNVQKSVSTYSLSENKILINDIIYDLTNPLSIFRSFKFCLRQGQGGGDAKPSCESITENCFLK